jgi:hypothetical protein
VPKESNSFLLTGTTGWKTCNMAEAPDILEQIRDCADRRILFLPHAIRQMAKPDRMITTTEIRSVIRNGEIIEDYENDVRGHSCLVLGKVNQRSVHVVCSPKDDYLAIITAYIPSDKDWESDCRTRKKQ